MEARLLAMLHHSDKALGQIYYYDLLNCLVMEEKAITFTRRHNWLKDII